MIRKSLQRLVRWANSYDQVFQTKSVDSISSNQISKEGMNFTIHPAAGGYILEYRVNYDHKNERSNNKLHIINEDQDLGESIGKIITLEILRT